ncbi:hypothetical protein CesoFtcFv8_017582 [Champsocephalus esox]|uniref:Uncharacterized protein n=1 Tax=Champsocephalus esox TaxID=159716 RepID=A0AAN8BKA7_9TELE|nr:hypothetical protein CesoFtcFv8_017582 [Champsocephalus esox]
MQVDSSNIPSHPPGKVISHGVRLSLSLTPLLFPPRPTGTGGSGGHTALREPAMPSRATLQPDCRLDSSVPSASQERRRMP